MSATDTITPTAGAIRTALLADTSITALVSQRVYHAAAPNNPTYPHIIMQPAAAPEADATHTDLSWQAQQWDIYAVADNASAANDIAGKIAGTLNDKPLTIGAAKALICRRTGTLPATRTRISETISKYLAGTTMLIGIKTGGH